MDTDLLIEEQAGCSIEAMISSKGWHYFRKMEKRLIANVSMKKDMVKGFKHVWKFFWRNL